MKHPLFIKLAALAAVVLLLLIGLGQIEDVVRDRQHYRSMTAQNVASSLAGPQTLLGPLIRSAGVESWDVETGKGDERRSERHRDQPTGAGQRQGRGGNGDQDSWHGGKLSPVRSPAATRGCLARESSNQTNQRYDSKQPAASNPNAPR